jgi:hypothetical protein
MGVLWELLKAVADSVIAFIIHDMVQRIFTEDAFCWGWIWGIGTTLVTAVLWRWFTYLWNLIQKFFSATKVPASAPGPKPVDTTTGCGRGPQSCSY